MSLRSEKEFIRIQAAEKFSRCLSRIVIFTMALCCRPCNMSILFENNQLTNDFLPANLLDPVQN